MSATEAVDRQRPWADQTHRLIGRMNAGGGCMLVADVRTEVDAHGKPTLVRGHRSVWFTAASDAERFVRLHADMRAMLAEIDRLRAELAEVYAREGWCVDA